ncbi:MAG: hypothetical protein IJK03_04795 [Oscillospiraceae bacterium]|nr:hypothetical protein [Oscillospiraceae bacterium]
MENQDVRDVVEKLDVLYSMVSEAWGVPLGNDKCIIEREKALDIINDIKAALPSSISEAKRLVAARDEFIGNAKKEAEALRRTSEERARTLVEEQEVVRTARAKSSEMIATAEARSAELRRAATDYAEDIMRQAEESISSALATIQTAHSAIQIANGGRSQQFTSKREQEIETQEDSFITLQ